MNRKEQISTFKGLLLTPKVKTSAKQQEVLQNELYKQFVS